MKAKRKLKSTIKLTPTNQNFKNISGLRKSKISEIDLNDIKF